MIKTPLVTCTLTYGLDDDGEEVLMSEWDDHTADSPHIMTQLGMLDMERLSLTTMVTLGELEH